MSKRGESCGEVKGVVEEDVGVTEVNGNIISFKRHVEIKKFLL